MRRHDRVLRWLAGWLEDGRVESDVLVEQSAPTVAFPDGRLDITFETDGRRTWLDVAVVSVLTTNSRERTR